MFDETLDETMQCCPGCQKPMRIGAQFCASCGCNFSTYEQPIARVKSGQSDSGYLSRLGELKQVGWLFGLLLFSFLLLGLSGQANGSPWPGTILSGIDALIVVAFVGYSYRDLLPLLKLPQLKWREGMKLISVALVFIVLMSGYFALLEKLGIPMVRSSPIYLRAGWNIGAMLVLVSVMPPVFEELAFRGVIQTALERALDKREAWLIQAALFSVLHMLPIAFPSHFLMGLCFGYMRLYSKNLYPGMALHASWNTIVLLEELY